jgi:hypothetical protein
MNGYIELMHPEDGMEYTLCKSRKLSDQLKGG